METWKAEEKSRLRKTKIQVRENQKKEDTVGRNVRKPGPQITMFFQWFLVREEGKVSLKRWVRRSHVVRANIDDFLKLGCRNTAHRCGTKRVSKSKRTKHTSFGRLFKVRMSKQCTPLWREVRFQVKMHKTHHGRTTFGSLDVETWYLWREANFQVKMHKTHQARTIFLFFLLDAAWQARTTFRS